MANATITVLEADGTTETDVVVLDVGRQAAAASKSVAASTEDKAVLDAIAASLATLDNVVSGNEAQVDVLTINGVAPAFGAGASGSTVQRVVVANDQLATLNTTAQAMSAGFQLVSLPTDASLPAGTNAIGKLAANSGVDIGDVDVTSISAGENHLGEVGGKTAVRSVTLSTDTSAYASGDLIADTQQIDGFFRKTDGTGVINSINIIDEDAQGVALYIIFMSTSTSLGTENSAPNISDANLTAGFQGIVSVATTDYVTVSGTKVATIKNIGLPVQAVSGTDDLYIAVLNSTGTPTFTASGLEMRIGVLLD